jgi:hypothetical protein
MAPVQGSIVAGRDKNCLTPGLRCWKLGMLSCGKAMRNVNTNMMLLLHDRGF